MEPFTNCCICSAQCKNWGDGEWMNCCASCAFDVGKLRYSNTTLDTYPNGSAFRGEPYLAAIDTVKNQLNLPLNRG